LRAPGGGTELHRPDTYRIERAGWRQLVTPSASGYLNEVFVTELAPDDIEAAIDDAIAVYRSHRLATKWYVTPRARPSDLGERLARRGFDSWDVRAMGIDTERVIATSPVVAVSPVDETTLDTYLDTTLSGWAMGEDQRSIERQTHLVELRKLGPRGRARSRRVPGPRRRTPRVLARARRRLRGHDRSRGDVRADARPSRVRDDLPLQVLLARLQRLATRG
jgi:hypothetical protein